MTLAKGSPKGQISGKQLEQVYQNICALLPKLTCEYKEQTCLDSVE